MLINYILIITRYRYKLIILDIIMYQNVINRGSRLGYKSVLCIASSAQAYTVIYDIVV